MSRIKSCHAYEWVMSPICMRIQEPYTSFLGLWVSVVTDYQWVVSRHECWSTNSHMNDDPKSPTCPSGDCEWVMSQTLLSHVTHTNESCHAYEFWSTNSHMFFLGLWVSHVTDHQWGMSHVCMLIHELLYVLLGTLSESCHTHARGMSHIWMSRVTHTSESCHSYERGPSQPYMSFWGLRKNLVTHMNESHHTHEWVMAHTWKGHATHTSESRHTHAWVISHTWIVMSHTFAKHGTHVNKCFTHWCDVTQVTCSCDVIHSSSVTWCVV